MGRRIFKTECSSSHQPSLFACHAHAYGMSQHILRKKEIIPCCSLFFAGTENDARELQPTNLAPKWVFIGEIAFTNQIPSRHPRLRNRFSLARENDDDDDID